MDAIRFGTDGWRTTLDQFTPERVRAVGQAVATYLEEEVPQPDPLLIGYDAREDSRRFAKELGRVVAANGRDVLLVDRDCPTPLVAWGVVDRGLAGALMVTASHNPPSYNGVKFLPSNGAPALPAVTDAIEARIGPPNPVSEAEWGRIREISLVDTYLPYAIDLVVRQCNFETSLDLDGLMIAYDAMHGSGRGITDALLERVGGVIDPYRCVRDPAFGGVPPEPIAKHLQPVSQAVTAGDADLGIANDGDADRIAVMTPERGLIDANDLFAVLYDFLLETDTGPAVRTVSTTFLIDRIAAAHDQTVVEVPVGFKWVAEAMADHDALIGGEESGGFSIRNHVREKDGVLIALLVAAAHNRRPLDDRLDHLETEFGTTYQLRQSLDCPDNRKTTVITALRDGIPEEIAGVEVDRINDADGFKVLLDDGSWLLVRPSGTEPKLRLYAEATDADRTETLLAAGEEIVNRFL